MQVAGKSSENRRDPHRRDPHAGTPVRVAPVQSYTRGRGRAPVYTEVGRREVVDVRHWHVHYQVAGPEDGLPVILVHGLAASWRWWEYTVPALAQRYRVYAVDLPGFGRTRPKRPFSLAGAVEMLAGWTMAAGLENATFVGHSMGGHVCIRLAREHPHLVQRLVLVNASGLPLKSPLPLLVINAIRAGAFEPPSFSLRMIASSLRAGPLMVASAAFALLADDVQEELHHLAMPTLVIWGDRDHLVPLPLGRALADAIPGAQLIVIEGAGHKAMVERANEFNRLLLDYLGQPLTGG